MSYFSKFIHVDSLVRLVNWVSGICFAFYIISMALLPWINQEFKWAGVQDVWDRWQTFNAGVLAFFASVIAFNIARYTDNQKRQRQFVAARSICPRHFRH